MKQKAFGVVLCILAALFTGCTGSPAVNGPDELDAAIRETSDQDAPPAAGRTPADDFDLWLDENGIIITGYKGTAATVHIPAVIDGVPVIGIGDWTFFLCSSLISITIPDSVTSIGSFAFSGCSSLISITVDATNAQYSSVNGILFSKDNRTLVCYPAGKTYTAYTIPGSVTSIGYYAFDRYDSLSAASREAIRRRFGDRVF